MKSELIRRLEKIITSSYVEDNEIILELNQILNEFQTSQECRVEPSNISRLGSDKIEELSISKGGDNTIKSGFAMFDKQFGGLTCGELVVIGGRPAMGKTFLLCNLALNISIEQPLLYITLDLPESTLINRLLSTISNIELSKLTQPNLSEEEKALLNNIRASLKNYKISISERSHNSLSELRSYCQNQIKENGVKVIMIDYLQMMNSQEANIRHIKVGSFTHELRKIAKDFNVCVIATSQLSRAVEIRGGDKRPQLADLKDSGAIEQDADKVIFIYRPEYYRISVNEEGYNTEGMVELIMAKNRNGDLGTVTLKRNNTGTKLMDYKYSDNPNYFHSMKAKRE